MNFYILDWYMNISVYWFIQGLVVLSTVQTQTYLGQDTMLRCALTGFSPGLSTVWHILRRSEELLEAILSFPENILSFQVSLPEFPPEELSDTLHKSPQHCWPHLAQINKILQSRQISLSIWTLPNTVTHSDQNPLNIVAHNFPDFSKIPEKFLLKLYRIDSISTPLTHTQRAWYNS
jgi:hypothetical protein